MPANLSSPQETMRDIEVDGDARVAVYQTHCQLLQAILSNTANWIRHDLQEESSSSASGGKETSRGLASGTGELRGGGLGAAGLAGNVAGGVDWDGAVLGGAAGAGNRAGHSRHNRLAGDNVGSGLDDVGAGELALIIDDGGGAGHGVRLAAVGDSGGLGADGGQALVNLGGGVGRSRAVDGVDRGLAGGGGVDGGGDRGRDRVVRSRGRGGARGRGRSRSRGLSRVAVSSGVGASGGESDDSEGAHVD